MPYRFDLMFKEQLPGKGEAYITLKHYPTDKKGNICITPMCASLIEMESAIDVLVDELKSIRKTAKKKFAKEKVKSAS